jgi:hypothetical protein
MRSLAKTKPNHFNFSEGLCVNEWKLRTLKKGNARLALIAIQMIFQI